MCIYQNGGVYGVGVGGGDGMRRWCGTALNSIAAEAKGFGGGKMWLLIIYWSCTN